MKSRGLRKTNLPDLIHAYTLAATAAGVGALALAQPAEAKIVYTKTNVQIQPHEYNLDLNNDGTPDFGLCVYSAFGGSCNEPAPGRRCGVGHQSLLVLPAKAESQLNEIYATAGGWAAALRRGYHIGPKRKFQPGRRTMATFTSCPPYGSHGPWANQMHHYLGLTFILKGKVHYGWARLDVSVINTATLTGYAYETVPNKAIIAGQTKGPDVVTVSDTLGGLAKGAVNHPRKVSLPKPH